jgi:hypothetical protein
VFLSQKEETIAFKRAWTNGDLIAYEFIVDTILKLNPELASSVTKRLFNRERIGTSKFPDIDIE